MNKKIEHILEGREKNIGVETILQPLPHKDFRFASPFIVIHHLPARYYEPGSRAERIPPHPHRGFSPVTFMFQGEGFHKDSAGNKGIVKSGEVQWMFAGKGILHSEGPTEAFLKKGGNYEFVQIWVNVPAKNKMDEPWYKHAKKEDMPPVSDTQGVNLKLVSGTYKNLSGPIQTITPVTAVFGSIDEGGTIELDAKEGDWTLLYLLEGSLLFNDKEQVGKHHLIVFSKEGSNISIQAKERTKLLFLSGQPINEPVAAKGNIVMNTQEEIAEAEQDYREGKFGVLDF